MGNKINGVRWYKVSNGDFLDTEWEGNCCKCGEYIHCSYPSIISDDGDLYCGECAFINGLINEQTYIKRFCSWCTFIKRAAVYDGEVYTAEAKEKFPWEKTDKDYRQSKQYKEWRSSVFNRDNFTCVICGQVGGTLNAHHIKPFKKFPRERFNVDNGVTLCQRCHRKIHKGEHNEWLYLGEQGHSE